MKFSSLGGKQERKKGKKQSLNFSWMSECLEKFTDSTSAAVISLRASLQSARAGSHGAVWKQARPLRRVLNMKRCRWNFLACQSAVTAARRLPRSPHLSPTKVLSQGERRATLSATVSADPMDHTPPQMVPVLHLHTHTHKKSRFFAITLSKW